MENENNGRPVLQKDRIFARILNLIPGVDAHKYNTEQLNDIADSYLKACGAGAIVGAAAGGIPTAGIGAGPGAAIGCMAGVGFRVYGLGIDTVSISIDKFQINLKRDNNGIE